MNQTIFQSQPVWSPTSWRWRTLLRVCGRVWPSSRRAWLCSQPLLVAKLWKPGSLGAGLPGRVQEVAVGAAKSYRETAQTTQPHQLPTEDHGDCRGGPSCSKIQGCASFLTQIFKLFLQGHAVVGKALLANEGVPGGDNQKPYWTHPNAFTTTPNKITSSERWRTHCST